MRFHPGHRALSAQNLPLVRFNFCAWISPPTLPARILLRPKPSPLGGRCLAEGQTDEGAFPIKPSPFKGEGAPEGGG